MQLTAQRRSGVDQRVAAAAPRARIAHDVERARVADERRSGCTCPPILLTTESSIASRRRFKATEVEDVAKKRERGGGILHRDLKVVRALRVGVDCFHHLRRDAAPLVRR